MKKRMLAALLAASLSLALALPSLAAPAGASEEEALQAVTALGIMAGDGQGNMNLSSRVTRAEFVTMAVRATPGGDQIGQAATSPYPDVPRSHWASGFVEAGVAKGLVSGYSDGTFRPGREIGLAEGAAIALSLLGYGAEDFSGAFPTGQLALYHSLRLDRGVSAAGADTPLTRRDAMFLFYNLLSAPTKQGQPYLNSLGHSLDASGKVDLLQLVSGEMEGPVVARDGWRSRLPFTPGKVIRDGRLSTLSGIQDYDVLYWNVSMDTLWAYTQKATGPIQALEPSGGSPTSVTVAGRAYSIESSSAAYDLSDLGQYRLGDTVTLLLGRTGGVVAVAGAQASAGEKIGVVVDVANASYPDGMGGSYTARSVTLLATDGRSYQYQTSSGVREGSVVRAAVQDGQVTLRALSGNTLTGKVSAAGDRLGNLPFAAGIQILDFSGKQGAVLYPSRLAGLTLSGGMVRYYSLNGQGEIDQLILEDVTGDMYRYGVLTQMEESGSGFEQYYSYQYLVDGASYSIPTSTTRWPVSRGPVCIRGEAAAPEGMSSLTPARDGQLSGGQFVKDNQRYPLSDRVAVYELRGGSYYLSSLARVQDGGYTLTAWYDKPQAGGGRVRVIVAQEN